MPLLPIVSFVLCIVLTDPALAQPEVDRKLIGRVTSKQLTEISGLAVGRHNPEVFWVHNDSGDGPNVYALARSGELLTTVELTTLGKVNDWEDLAIAVDPESGVSQLYVADIGNNGGRRTSIRIHRFEEPEIDLELENVEIAVDEVETFWFRYPDSSEYDAESVVVDPFSGDIFVITKRPGPSRVYRAATPFQEEGFGELEFVGELPYSGATAADLSPSGARFIAKTSSTVRLSDSNDPGGAHLRFKIWRSWQDEPEAWTVTAHDPQTNSFDTGQYGVRSWMGASATGRAELRFDNYRLTSPNGDVVWFDHFSRTRHSGWGNNWTNYGPSSATWVDYSEGTMVLTPGTALKSLAPGSFGAAQSELTLWFESLHDTGQARVEIVLRRSEGVEYRASLAVDPNGDTAATIKRQGARLTDWKSVPGVSTYEIGQKLLTKARIDFASGNISETLVEVSPVELEYKREPQGEAIAWDPDEVRFYTISEGRNRPIYEYTITMP